MSSTLHLSNVMGPAGGGVAKVVESYIWAHIKHNEHCHLWYAGCADLADLALFHPHAVRIKEIGYNYFIPPALFYELNRILGHGSIIHQHGVFKPTSLLTLYASNCVARVVSPHGYLEPEKLLVSRAKKKFAMSLYELHNLKKADALIACSEQEAGHLKSLDLGPPIFVVPNSVDDNICCSTRDENKIKNFKKMHQLDDEVRILGILSRIHPFKGYTFLLDVISELRELFLQEKWVCFIAGVNEDGYEDYLKNDVQERGLGNIIKFIGPLFGESKITFYDSIDGFVLPSRGENFGLVIAEAMARGLPVVTTKSTPWNILREKNCGWWLDRNKDEFCRAITEILLMKSENLKAMGARGRTHVLTNFTQDRIFNVLKGVYNDVLKFRSA